MSEVKLKPCPFCGGENIMLDKTKEDTLHLVVCRNCVAQVSGFTRDGAIRAWNRRKPMEDIVAELEKRKSYNQMMLKKFPKMGTVENAIYKTQRDTYENAIEIVKGGVE